MLRKRAKHLSTSSPCAMPCDRDCRTRDDACWQGNQSAFQEGHSTVLDINLSIVENTHITNWFEELAESSSKLPGIPLYFLAAIHRTPQRFNLPGEARHFHAADNDPCLIYGSIFFALGGAVTCPSHRRPVCRKGTREPAHVWGQRCNLQGYQKSSSPEPQATAGPWPLI